MHANSPVVILLSLPHFLCEELCYLSSRVSGQQWMLEVWASPKRWVKERIMGQVSSIPTSFSSSSFPPLFFLLSNEVPLLLASWLLFFSSLHDFCYFNWLLFSQVISSSLNSFLIKLSPIPWFLISAKVFPKLHLSENNFSEAHLPPHPP